MNADISILIPHYNNLKGLQKTLKSLSSKHRVDLIIVDDGSIESEKPSDKNIAKCVSSLNSKIHLIHQDTNQGVEQTLNHGLIYITDELKSKYIFRIDSGDLCIGDRIDVQVDYLEKNQDICLVGSWVKYVNEHSEELFKLKLPVAHDQIKNRMFVRVPFIHSAVLFRTKALQKVGFYTTNYKAAEDYAFFLRFVNTCTTANIPKYLTQVEWNPKGISPSKRMVQLKSRLSLLIDNAKLNHYFIYGVLRVIILMIIPYKIIEFLKKKIY